MFDNIDPSIQYFVCARIARDNMTVEFYTVKNRNLEVLGTFGPDEKEEAEALARELTLRDKKNES